MADSNGSKLNVLLVVPWDQESGGVAAVVGYLARHLQSEGHRVLFFHPGMTESMRPKTTKWGFDGVELKLRTPSHPRYPIKCIIGFLLTLPLTLFRIGRFLLRHDIDIVNVHYPGDQFIYFAILRRLLPIRLVVSIHGTDAIRWDAPSAQPSSALRMLYRAADLIVAPSWRFLRRCDEVLSCSSARKLAIHNGTELSDLEHPPAQIPRFARNDEAFILSVCSLDPWKGVDVLIRAMAQLGEAHGSTHLVVAGEGPQRAELERLVAELGLDGRVLLAGMLPHATVTQLLRSCTLFVLASRFETFGIAALEAMACGKPVIGSAVDGILEIIDDGETGRIVAADDPMALAAAIDTLLDDPALRERLGAAARARVQQMFQRERMGSNYMHAYREVLADGA